MLDLEHVKKQYGSFRLDCSLKLRQGQVSGLIGKNGAGKSTAFKLILGLIYADSGNIRVFGKEKLEAHDKENIGVVLADSGYSGYLKAKDLLPIMNSVYARFDKDYFLQLCDTFHIPMDKKIMDFSTGMKAKLKIAAALSHEAKLLILDEPTSGLDVIARNMLLDLLREYIERTNAGILISSHISSDLEGLCDDLYMIDNGQIILHEDTDVLLDSYAVLKVSEKQYQALDKRHFIKVKREAFGYSCLTDKKQFYLENYPEIIIEKGNIDETMMLMVKGEDCKRD